MHVLFVQFLKDHSTSALEGLKSQSNVRLMYTEEKAAAMLPPLSVMQFCMKSKKNNPTLESTSLSHSFLHIDENLHRIFSIGVDVLVGL